MWRQLLRANLVYAIGSAANSAALFLLVPYLVNVFTPEEYGAWSIFEVAILLLNMVMLAGLEVGLMREYWFLSDDKKRAQLAGSVLLTVALWGGMLFAGGVFFVAGGIRFSLPGAPLTLMEVLAIAWLETIFTLYLTLFRIREQAFTFVMLSVGRMVLFMGLSIGLVHCGYGLPGALLGRLGGTILMLSGASALGFRYISLRLDIASLKRVIWYGLPLLPTNLASYILLASDRYMLQHFAALEAVAVYTFAYKVAATLDVLITRPFALDWAPRRFKIATQSDPPRRYAQALLFYLWAAVSFSLCVVALTPAFYRWVAPSEYWPGMKLVPVILLAYLIYGLSYPLNVGIMLKDRTQYLPIIGWTAALICLGLNFWWIPRYGMAGAAWATVVAYGFWTGGITWVSLCFYPVRYPLWQVGIILAAGMVGYTGLWCSEKARLLSGNFLAITALRFVWVLGAMIAGGLLLLHQSRRNGCKVIDGSIARVRTLFLHDRRGGETAIIARLAQIGRRQVSSVGEDRQDL